MQFDVKELRKDRPWYNRTHRITLGLKGGNVRLRIGGLRKYRPFQDIGAIYRTLVSVSLAWEPGTDEQPLPGTRHATLALRFYGALPFIVLTWGPIIGSSLNPLKSTFWPKWRKEELVNG